jgi:hypothetical protein
METTMHHTTVCHLVKPVNCNRVLQSCSLVQYCAPSCISHAPQFLTHFILLENEYNFGQNMLVSYKVLDLQSFSEASFSLKTTHTAVLLHSNKFLLVQISHIIINGFDMVSLLCSKHDGNFFNTQHQFYFSRSVQAQSVSSSTICSAVSLITCIKWPWHCLFYFLVHPAVLYKLYQ